MLRIPNFLPALICLTIITSGLAQSCSAPSPQTDFIDSGKLTLTKRGSGREHCFSVPIGFNSSVDRTQVAISTSRINGYKPSSGFDFSITAGRQSSNYLGINVQINEDSRWTSLEISYLISSRADLLLGSFVTTLFPLTSCSALSSSSALINTYIPISSLPPTQVYKIQAFISGIRSASSSFNLRISNSELNKADGKISIHIQSTSSPGVELLFISYVIYPEVHQNFDFQIGNSLQSSYRFEGINNFLISQSVQTAQWNICKKSQSNQPPMQCKIHQKLVNGNCQCLTGYVKVNSACYLSCATNAYVYTNWTCTCLPGYHRNTIGTCVENLPDIICSINQIANGSSCICKNGFVKDSKNKCVQIIKCGNNQKNVNNICQCVDGFQKNSKEVCIKVVACEGMDEAFDIEKEACDCRYGFIRVGPACVNRCGLNQQWKQQKCLCIHGTAYINYACRPCPSASISNSDRTNCICDGNRLLNTSAVTLSCGGCPTNSILSQNQCICSGNYTWNSNKTSCELKNVECPKDSIWSVDKLQCLCALEGQHIINGKCQACPNSQNWNGTICECPNGLFLINQICKSCPLASSYNGNKCQCNLGYFQVNETCQQCDPTCSKCTGPSPNQCTSCVDITYEFKNGYCSKSSTCPLGTYLNGQVCSRCSDYCQSCSSQLECMKCTIGFELKLHIIQNMGYTTCESVCGDGKKVDLEQCDDGNIISGDGCNGECKVENGWSCSGGTSGQASKCIHGIPTRSLIQVKGAVTQIGKVVQGVRMSYIPTCFTDRDCADCYRILDVKVVEGNMPTQVKVNFMPNSEGQFVIDYSFGGFVTSTIFKYQIQINKNLPSNYANCFNAEDYAQQIVGVIDSALLAKSDQTGQLTLDEILGEGDYSAETLNKIFK